MPTTRWLLMAATAALALPLLFTPRPFAATGLQPPLPAELAEGAGIVKSRYWAVALGKALFWDEQAGSDGMACASCHFHAGADSRIKNQLTPGFLDVTKGPEGDTYFGSEYSETSEVLAGYMPSGALAGPNYTLTAADFPLHQLEDETNRDSRIRTTTNDRVSSAGAFDAEFTRVRLLGFRDRCGRPSGEVFHAGRYAARQVEPRQTPTVINAVFNHRNFWDGRANNLFNGVGVFGMRDIVSDPDNRLIILENGRPTLGYLAIPNASLASQAVGPPLSALEMSCDGRTFADVGRKLLLTAPLRLQTVHRQDSVLGPLASPSGRGLRPGLTYAELIRRAFEPKYWAAPGWFRIVNGQLLPALPLIGGGYTQMEINFPMFWGIAIMLYEATLVSDRSEFDTLVSTGQLIVNDGAGGFNCQAAAGAAVDPLLLRGCQTFFRVPFNPAARGAGCVLCHGGKDLFTTAAFQQGETFPPLAPPLGNALGQPQVGDTGFFNIGLRPPAHDALAGGADPYGYPLSFARQYRRYLQGVSPVVDPVLQDAIDSAGPGPLPLGDKLGVDGAAKTPTLRNVALTPPYFSFGGFATLRQVLKFYNRGGNRRAITGTDDRDALTLGSACATGDDSGTGPEGDSPLPVNETDCGSNASGLLNPLGLLDCDANGVEACDPATDDLAALERFLKSLTDRRVQCDQAPFDHPSLRVVHGHSTQDRNRDGKADDIVFELPAAGAGGYSPASGYCIPNAGDLFAPGMQARAGGPRVPLAE